MANKTLKRLLRVIIGLNLIVGIGLSNLYVQAFTYADGTNVSTSITLSIAEGIWDNIYDGIIQLELMTEEELKQPIPDDTLFMYQGKLYIKRPSETYIPWWNGMPGERNNVWAMFALDLEWIPNTNYRNNSVVTKNGKYYITNTSHNNNWFIADPETDGSHWLKIEPISEEHFGYLEGTSLRDYSKPDWDHIDYK